VIPRQVRAHAFFRGGAIQFAHPDVKRIALSRGTQLRGKQEQANPKDSQKRASSRWAGTDGLIVGSNK